jgi:hypothetical protein
MGNEGWGTQQNRGSKRPLLKTPNSQLITLNSQLITHNSQLITHNSQLPLPPPLCTYRLSPKKTAIDSWKSFPCHCLK